MSIKDTDKGKSDSNVALSMIRTKLSNLDEYLTATNNDILKFNNHVRMLIDSLTARGETTQDLLSTLHALIPRSSSM